MASQTVTFEYDESKNILFVEDDYVINSEDEVDAFLKLYADKFKVIGRKVRLVACIDGLKINHKVQDYYGEQVKKLLEGTIICFARYGRDPMSRMTVRTASRKVNFDINIYDTKEQAIEAVERIK
ncbi:MAG: hypothetical protein A2024_05560 [Candidatus Edwardsbacteria bacterium GWF2_54_11]|uniref:Uncharacterized protein n=1 Tax=Candidatus Edwardsbacteria bacterium GWF2_54_11 TaxID=1817851 RepID=A0A1F5RIJ6_9BACT|nr:MAG: hypothetical protein A2502_07125 [Candidatus Edwardsbacteria bacterium RifOxyC12_full_54_24]OGF14003.1 MAG: hypothetical protein A2024_05560 [Candidatus Edwardsbacteria bacterium GWF2_54_11]